MVWANPAPRPKPQKQMKCRIKRWENTNSPWLSRSEVADYLRCSMRTVDRYLVPMRDEKPPKGQMRCEVKKTVGGRNMVRILAEDVYAIFQCPRANTAESGRGAMPRYSKVAAQISRRGQAITTNAPPLMAAALSAGFGRSDQEMAKESLATEQPIAGRGTAPKTRRPARCFSAPAEQLYLIEEVAQLWKVGTSFITELIKQKRLKAVNLSPDLVRVTARGLQEYLISQNSVENKAEAQIQTEETDPTKQI